MGGGEKKLRNPKGIRAKVHQERLARFQERDEQLHPPVRRGEAEIVAGYELSAVLRQWVVDWLAERPRNVPILEVYEDENASVSTTRRLTGGTHFMGPIDWLAEKTEIPVRRVSGIINGEYATVSLSQADKLLVAIGRNDMLATGEIGVHPNPHWSQEQWIEYMRERGCA